MSVIVLLIFIYKLCPFFLVSRFLTCLIPCDFFSFKMSSIEFFCFPRAFLLPFPVILACHTFSTGLLLFILIKSPNHSSYCLCMFFNIGSTFNFCLTISFLTLSLLVIPFILRIYFIYAAWILLLMSFVSTQLSKPYVRIGQKIASYTFSSLFCNCSHY